MKISVIIPAHNEELLIGHCLDSVDRAAARFSGEIETVVVLNRCADSTEDRVRGRVTSVVLDDSRMLSSIRNAGARHATGDVLVTIDADSEMSENMLVEIERTLLSGKYIGGGVPIRPERLSAGILLSGVIIFVLILPISGFVSAGLFWCYRRDFEAIGGFDESVHSAEDVDFARRLKAYGKKLGKRYGTLWRTRIITSCRKFDQFGDWFAFRLLLRHPVMVWRGLHGRDANFGEKYWYDVGR